MARAVSYIDAAILTRSCSRKCSRSAANWRTATGTNHWSYYIDADTFVDQHWIVEFPKQIDGYRFFYLLPWTPNSLLIEDTRYSSSPTLAKAQLEAEVVRLRSEVERLSEQFDNFKRQFE